MFHSHDNIFFGRKADGSVRIIQLPHGAPWPKADEEIPDLLFDFTVDPDGWASIVASVSKGGEEARRFYIASAFHKGEPVPEWATEPLPPGGGQGAKGE